MKATAQMTVYWNDDQEKIEIEIEGEFEWCGSHNPNERGYRLLDWRVLSPSIEFELTAPEQERAEELLYESVKEG